MAMDPTLDQIEQNVADCQQKLVEIANEIPLCDSNNAGGSHDPGTPPHNNPPDLQTQRLSALAFIRHALDDLTQCHDELSHGGGGQN